MSYYNIDSADGNAITQGIQSEVEARRAAQRMANERGESVYLYEVGGGDGESEVDSEEIKPESEDDDSDAANGCDVTVLDERLGGEREYSLAIVDDGVNRERVLRYRVAPSLTWLCQAEVPDEVTTVAAALGEF